MPKAPVTSRTAPTTTSTFVVDRGNLRATRWIEAEPGPLSDGSVRLRIDAFALTSNNITYAAFGEAMDYWRFFPTGDAAGGCIPVWGFADVVESRCDGVSAGERFYGYFPISSDVVLQPVRVDQSGFHDGAAHRRELNAVYNRYLRCSSDPSYDPTREAEQALLKPLFMTSFLIDDFLADNHFFGARSVLIASASSKTAYGTGFCLARRRGTPTAVQAIGLTSPANLGFTRDLGCYDRVLSYDEAGQLLDAAVATVYVDMSGSVPVRLAVHSHFGASLMYSCSVGGTHWNELGSAKGLPGPRPTLFFAPAQAQKRIAEWGAAGWQQRLDEAWTAFMKPVTEGPQPWLTVRRGQGRAAVEAAYAGLLDGSVDPRDGQVLRV